jgi:hypothetical protein
MQTYGTAVVEQTPCQCQDHRVAHQLLQTTQDSPVQSSPRFCIATPSNPSYLLYVLLPGTNVRTYYMSYLVIVLSCVAPYPSYLCCVRGMG